ncbi:MAG: DUF4192 domain-containing protein [Nocardioidaceae bacterium]
MTDPKTLRAKTPADLLAMVPFVLGFHPEDSLVVLTLGDADRPFHARVDLPADPDDVAGVADHLTETAVRHGLRSVALVVYSDDEPLAEAAVDALADRLLQGGVDVKAAVRADGERWFCLDDGPCACPVEGTPYDLSTHPFTAEAVVEGRVTYLNREALRYSLVGSDPEETEDVCRAADVAIDRFAASTRHPLGPAAPETLRAHQVAEGHWVGNRVARFLEDGLRLSADDVGRLLVAIVRVEVRDVAWSHMDRDSAARHVDLWRDVVRRSPHDLLAAPAALLGFAAWLAGDGALAWCAIDRCREADPDYSLAGLLADALTRAVPPSTWRPFGPDDLPLFAG